MNGLYDFSSCDVILRSFNVSSETYDRSSGHLESPSFLFSTLRRVIKVYHNCIIIRVTDNILPSFVV